MIGDTDGVITIKGKNFRGSECVLELFTRKKVNRKHVTSEDLRTYKKILLMTNDHLD